MKVLLTSCGLETAAIENRFREFLGDAARVKALFIPVAAINADAIEVLPKCIKDLLKVGILKENITVYDLHESISQSELNKYSVVYLCGGDTKYLLKRMNENGFSKQLLQYIDEEKGTVVGVSAGSLIFADNLEGNLGLLKTTMKVHCSEEICEPIGITDIHRKETIYLGNTQALVIEKEKGCII